MQLIECVPNISEGRDHNKIKAVTDVIETVPGVKLLDVDPGASTNRTVITFVGEPEAVIKAAFLVVQKAAEVIDMSQHKGDHPRFGATDVCPLVPVANISLEEVVPYAHKLAERIGKELNIPVYCYERAARQKKRENLAYCRSGQYEGLSKIAQEEWTPDFGPNSFDARVKKTGVTAVGARDFLVAYNINLNTTSARRANAIAFDIREAGRIKREGDSLTGKPILDAHGEPERVPGTLKAVKGIGWYIEEYGVAQLSLNLTNISITTVHAAFDEASAKAAERGIRVTGSEIVGLIPKSVLIDAADHYLKKQQRSIGVSEAEKIKIAVKSMGLDDLAPFDPSKKVIEYMIGQSQGKKLVDMNLTAFAEETASESPAPGGGSISAYVGALGVSLGTMVANLSAHKRGWDDRWETFSDWAAKGMAYQERLLLLVDEDTAAFTKIMDALGMAKGSEDEKRARMEALEQATVYATEVPLKIAETALESMEVMLEMAKIGNPASITDAGVGAMCTRTAVLGAIMNVKINAASLSDKKYVEDILAKCANLTSKTEALERQIREAVEEKL